MGIGACVTMIAAGAILTFATDWYWQGIDLNAVGVILMVAGVLGLAVTMQIFRPRSRPTPPRQPYPPQDGAYYPPPGQPHQPAGQYSQYPPHAQPPPYRGDGYR
jgi:hypothetical protein